MLKGKLMAVPEKPKKMVAPSDWESKILLFTPPDGRAEAYVFTKADLKKLVDFRNDIVFSGKKEGPYLIELTYVCHSSNTLQPSPRFFLLMGITLMAKLTKGTIQGCTSKFMVTVSYTSPTITLVPWFDGPLYDEEAVILGEFEEEE